MPQEVLATVLDAIEARRVSAEDAVSAHHEVERELGPLVHFALSLRPPDLPAASGALRQRVRSELRQSVEAEEEAAAVRSSFVAVAADISLALGVAARRIPEGLRLALGCVFAAVLLSVSVQQVAANSLPGDPAYGVKRLEESVTLALARSPEAKARIHLAQAARRLGEAHTLYLAGADNRAKAATADYSGSIVKGLAYLSAAEVELPFAELRETYERAFLIYQAATTQSPYLWDDDTRRVLREAWEGFSVVETDIGSEGRDEDRGNGDAQIGGGDVGSPTGKGDGGEAKKGAQPATTDQGPLSGGGEVDKGSKSAQSLARDERPRPGRVEDDGSNKGAQLGAVAEGAHLSEKSLKSRAESKLEGGRPEAKDNRPQAGSGKDDASKDSQSREQSRGAQQTVKAHGDQPAHEEKGRPAGKRRGNARTGTQPAEEGRGSEPVAKAHGDRPAAEEKGRPAGKRRGNARTGTQPAEEGRGSELVAKAHGDQPAAEEKGRPAGKPNGDVATGTQSAEKGRGPKLVAKADGDQPADEEEGRPAGKSRDNVRTGTQPTEEGSGSQLVATAQADQRKPESTEGHRWTA